MAKKKTSKKAPKKRTYLREVEIRFKKKRVSAGSPAGEKLTDPELVAELFRDLQNEGKEKLVAISLDVKMRIIAFEVVSIGTPMAIYSRPGECARTPVLVGAKGMILVHNHPSGDPTPSEEDKEFTWQLTLSCESLGIPLLDHVIIGADEFYSFGQEGWMEKYRTKAQKQLSSQRPKKK